MISLKHSFVFIHNQKTGGRSIVHMFSDCDLDINENIKNSRLGFFDTVDVGHMNLHQIIAKYPNVSDWDKFCVIRNPYDRMLSWYFYTRRNNGYDFDNERFKLFLRKHKTIQSQVERISIDGEIDESVKIIRFERYEQDLKRILSELLVTIPDIILHENESKHEHYSRYYTQETIDMVTEQFQDDLDYFGYTFDCM